jgi:hypothetical protein
VVTRREINRIVDSMIDSLDEGSEAISEKEYELVMKNLEKISMTKRKRYIEKIVLTLNKNFSIIPRNPNTEKNYGDRIESELARLPNNPIKEGDLLGMELKSLDISRSDPLRLSTKNIAARILLYLREIRNQYRYTSKPLKYTDVIYYPKYPEHNPLQDSEGNINQLALERHWPPLLAVTYPNYSCGAYDGKLNRLKFEVEGEKVKFRVRPEFQKSSGTGTSFLKKDVTSLDFDVNEIFSKFRNGFLLVLYKSYNTPHRGFQIQRVLYCSLKIQELKQMLIDGEITVNFRLKGGKKPASTNDSFEISRSALKIRMHEGNGFTDTINWKCPDIV